MNEKIYNIKRQIEEKLNKTKNDKLKNEYKEILNEENEINKLVDDDTVLKMETIEYKKKKYYARLELFYEHVCEDYIILIEDIKETINNNQYNQEELVNLTERIREKIDNDESMSISEYEELRTELYEILIKIEALPDQKINKKEVITNPNEKQIIKPHEKNLIKPRKSIFKKFITPKDFYKQFCFYPKSRKGYDERLTFYDLSYIDYSDEDLTYANFKGTNFSFNLDLLKNKDISRANFKNTNVKVSNMNDFYFVGTNFEGVDLSHTTLSINHIRGIYEVNFRNTGLNIFINDYVHIKHCNLEGCNLINNNGIAIDVDGSNLKDMGITIDLEKIWAKGLKMTNGDYRGCYFLNIKYFNYIDKAGSEFDEILLEPQDKIKSKK